MAGTTLGIGDTRRSIVLVKRFVVHRGRQPWKQISIMSYYKYYEYCKMKQRC